jgi:hypothetical protein
VIPGKGFDDPQPHGLGTRKDGAVNTPYRLPNVPIHQPVIATRISAGWTNYYALSVVVRHLYNIMV